jgi:hypothetical protein
MCELFAISSRSPVTLDLSLEAFSRHGGSRIAHARHQPGEAIESWAPVRNVDGADVTYGLATASCPTVLGATVEMDQASHPMDSITFRNFPIAMHGLAAEWSCSLP